jgi:four helix bundle protein
MTEIQNSKHYDLEKRTLDLARRVRLFVEKLPRTIANLEDIKQILRSSSSVGANYIEANESLSKKDFVMRIKICRKESKETEYWLQLLNTNNNTGLEAERKGLIQEVIELRKIFGAILKKSNLKKSR